ncbi:MAG: Abi family protein [Lachnospiraceae bacterium]|nr:Abi family protein [Lachnospiraceae bacterium]
MDKTFKTYDELIAILISRGVDISTPEQKSFAKKKLQHHGYYNLINGYNKLFLLTKDPDDAYIPGTTVNEIYALYVFDSKLRDIFFRNIIPVEQNVKNLISYTFSERYGHDNYMLYRNFDTHRKDSVRIISDVISEVQRQISSRSSDPVIFHYLSTYGYVPLWVLNNILTLGTISKFYSIMKQPDRQEISKIFRIQDSQLETVLFYISSVRNFCAHGNRLYCYRTKRPLGDFPAHNSLSIPMSDGKEYDYGKRDLFACLIALHYVLPTSDYRKMLKEIRDLLNETEPELSVIKIDDILHEMGFPSDWFKSLNNLKK